MTRRWPLAAAASAAGALIVAAPTVLALHIVARDTVAHGTVVQPVAHYEPAITTQAAARISPLAGWPATLRFALRIGL
ncbi:MAG TPA: hypothetical protein VN738_09870, partial [Acidothermaceae bacterium]|nr:hypothetical protein [Acidothermaceae bacterium]